MKQKLWLETPYRKIVVFAVPLILLLIITIYSTVSMAGEQFSELAWAFLHGHLNFLNPIGGIGQDPVLYHGKIYWDDGPFPSIVLMPFVGALSLFHLFFFQGYLQWLLILGIIYFVFRLARVIGYSQEDSLILMLGFALGSVFIGVAGLSSSWLFAQVLTTLLLFGALYEFYTRRRWWILGLLSGCLVMTRIPAAGVLLFFVLELLHPAQKKQQDKRRTALLQLLWPVVAAGVLLGLYNFLRFHSPFNNGNAYQLISADSAEARSLGLFSLVHIPTNFYSALLRGPVTVLRSTTSWSLKFPYIKNNPYGMSIFITSPYLLSLFFAKWRSFDRQARHLLITAILCGLVVFSYYGIGIYQFGYRYSLDFLPELFVLFMIVYRRSHERLSGGMKSVLLGSGVANFYLAWPFLF